MNVYDFDGTICYPDSSVNFAIYCMNHHPHLWLTFFPQALRNLIRYKRGKMTRARMMLKFFTILRVKDFDRLIERYWDTHVVFAGSIGRKQGWSGRWIWKPAIRSQ